jgi:hypothetical protein
VGGGLCVTDQITGRSIGLGDPIDSPNHFYHPLTQTQLLRVAAVLIVLDTHSRYAVYAHAASAATTTTDGSSSSSSSSSSGHAPPTTGHPIVTAAAAAGAAGGVLFTVAGEDPTDTPAFQLRLILRLLALTLLEHAAFAALVVGGAVWMLSRRRRTDAAAAAVADGGSKSREGLPSSPPLPSPPLPPYSPSHLAQKLLQALLYPAFGRLLVPFIMVWDPAVAVAGVIGALVLSSQWQALHAVVTSAPFALSAETAAVPSCEAVVALPFLLGLVGRAGLRLLLAGRVVALESFVGAASGGARGVGLGM